MGRERVQDKLEKLEYTPIEKRVRFVKEEHLRFYALVKQYEGMADLLLASYQNFQTLNNSATLDPYLKDLQRKWLDGYATTYEDIDGVLYFVEIPPVYLFDARIGAVTLDNSPFDDEPELDKSEPGKLLLVGIDKVDHMAIVSISDPTTDDVIEKTRLIALIDPSKQAQDIEIRKSDEPMDDIRELDFVKDLIEDIRSDHR